MNRLPHWFRQDLPNKDDLLPFLNILRGLRLQTVCENAHCPNLGRCFSYNTLTFMILGNVCTRNCGFCAVENDGNLRLDGQEPYRVGVACALLGLKYIVITSVTRDDLPDAGAGQFCLTVESIRQFNSRIKIELLIPDFGGSLMALEKIVQLHPQVIGHNIDTIPRLYKKVKDSKSSYKRSLNLLKGIKDIDSTIYTKSSLMLGLGEIRQEVINTMKDLREN